MRNNGEPGPPGDTDTMHAKGSASPTPDAAESVELPSPVLPCVSEGLNHAEPIARDALWSWLRAHGLGDDETASHILQRADPAMVAATLYPRVPAAQLTLITQWLAVNFLVDDELDNESAPDRCRAAAAEFASALSASPDACTAPIAAVLPDLWRSTQRGRSADWCRVFVQDLVDWLQSYAVEAEDRLHGRLPTPDEYLRHRRASSGMLVFVDLVEPAVGADLPEHVRHHEVMTTLRTITAEHMGLVNDMYFGGQGTGGGAVPQRRIHSPTAPRRPASGGAAPGQPPSCRSPVHVRSRGCATSRRP